jgi:formiminotetrahydrofolate cyclodeaminase
MKDFLERLSSDSPTPGGGSASALAGALSASLTAMVAGLSRTKGGDSQSKMMQQIRRRSLGIQERLSRAVDQDAESFEAVMNAFQLPKRTEKERLRRQLQIRRAYRNATVVPRLVCERCLELLEFSETLMVKGNRNAITDAGVAALLADAALSGALLNIQINMTSLNDREFLTTMRSSISSWRRKRNRLMKKLIGLFDAENLLL